MKYIARMLIIAGLLVFGATVAQQDKDPLVNSGGLQSLRGMSELNDTREAERMKRIQPDRAPIDRNYVHQPPLIPHEIRDYDINTRANKCLSCHGWKNAGDVGATKISPTHFVTREGVTLSDVAPNRYFCTQCHVPQAEARPLVDNAFEPVESISQ